MDQGMGKPWNNQWSLTAEPRSGYHVKEKLWYTLRVILNQLPKLLLEHEQQEETYWEENRINQHREVLEQAGKKNENKKPQKASLILLTSQENGKRELYDVRKGTEP